MSLLAALAGWLTHGPAGAVVAVLGATYALWVLYLAAMNLRRAKEAGRLTRWALAFALPVLVVAIAVDVAVNLVLATLVFLDRPREWTVSERLSRYLRDLHDVPGYWPGDSIPRLTLWRARVALWVGEHLLDPFDPSGQHLRR